MRLALFFILLCLFTSAPIWAVQYFINQDGSGHVHSAWVMTELLRGNPRFTDIFQFNFIFFPDVAGHWLMALMLLFVSAFTVAKVMTTLTYVGLVAAVGWLRWRTAGSEGLLTSFLIGGALAFNWLRLEGFYNFNLGFALAVFAIGCYPHWQEEMDASRATMLALLFFLIFVGHIVSFAIAAGTIAMLCILPIADMSRRRLLWSIAAFIPVAPITAIYKISTEASGRFTPLWRSLDSHYSLSSWLTQLRSADSFIIISRLSFPFVQADSIIFAIFTPFIWIILALALLLAATLFTRLRERHLWESTYLPFIALNVVCVFVSIFSPDNFQFWSSTGGVLRERVLLIGLICLVPLYRTSAVHPVLNWLAGAALVFVIIFQTAALWEYGICSNRDAQEFFSASSQVPNGSSLAAITITSDGTWFSANDASSMANYFGVDRDILVWDNYEFGHYLFPVIAKNQADRDFVFEFATNNKFELNNPNRFSRQRIDKLAQILAVENQRIDTLLVCGSDKKIETVYEPWFEERPYFENGRVRLYRHK